MNHQKQTLLFLGDSITDSDRLWDEDGENLGCGYVRILARSYSKYQIINRGHNGFTAYQVDKYLDEDCLRWKPDVVTLLVGINDVSARMDGACGYDSVEYGKILRHILNRIRQNGCEKLLLMEPFLFPEPAIFQTWMEELGYFRQEARRVAEAEGALFLPLAELFQHSIDQYGVSALTTDGIHLTSLGHKILAEVWQNYNTYM